MGRPGQIVIEMGAKKFNSVNSFNMSTWKSKRRNITSKTWRTNGLVWFCHNGLVSLVLSQFTTIPLSDDQESNCCKYCGILEGSTDCGDEMISVKVVSSTYL